jgi:parallel beta-helix repeat protein
MKSALLSALFAAASFWPLVCSKSLLAQGSLTPPGAPTPTMKSLDQIEARTPIDSLPFTIGASGSYYLTRNLTATGSGAGLTVSADNVTIDLNGFTLAGGGSGTVSGINVPNAQTNLCVRNGTVSGWAGGGIIAPAITVSIVEKVRVLGNSGGSGITVNTGCTVRECEVSGSTGANCNGIGVGGKSSVLGCNVWANNGGIVLGASSTVTNCTASGNAGTGVYVNNNSSVAHCTASANGGGGFYLSDGCTITDCAASSNTGLYAGIYGGVGGTVANCSAASNAPCGISVSDGCTVRGCTVRNNASQGILVSSSDCYLVGNAVAANNTANSASGGGMVVYGSGNRIESNNFANNTNAGLYISGPIGHTPITGNLIVGNSFAGPSYIIDTGNTVGPLVNKSSAGGTLDPTTNSLANIVY